MLTLAIIENRDTDKAGQYINIGQSRDTDKVGQYVNIGYNREQR